MHRVSDDGLAGHYNTTLSTLHFFAERKRFELLRLLHPVCFQDSFHDHPVSLHCVSGWARPAQGGITDRHDSPTSPHSHFSDYAKASTDKEDEERFELSTLPLTTGRSAVELFILFCLNDDLGRLKGCFRF